ncbi:DCTP1-like protein, partial [Mya arenaria]
MADNNFKFSEKPSLEEIRQKQQEFAQERNWDQYHTPRNLLMALVGEVGELAEIFQWKGEVKEGLPERDHVGQELADVFLYLVRLSEKCHIDLPSAVWQKIQKNAQKYPAGVVYGKSDKYTEYVQNGTISSAAD